VITADGRTLVGQLVSCDNQTNLVCFFIALQPPRGASANFDDNKVLQSTIERIIRDPEDPEPSAEEPLGLYIVRGDNVCTVGLVDEDLDDSIDWTKVKGAAIGGTKHS
jgi:U6 snRNA-associated Sm-like protein LSm8